MIAQYRPDIARVAEETVVNLKEVENRMEALKTDLAWLCTSLGHPEAARVAATPARALGFNPYAAPVGVTTQALSPFIGQIQPFGNIGPAAQIAGNPYATFGGIQAGLSPFGQIQPSWSFGLGVPQVPSAFGIAPFGLGLGFGQPMPGLTSAFGPYAISPTTGVGLGIPSFGNVQAAFASPYNQVGAFAQYPTIPVR